MDRDVQTIEVELGIGEETWRQSFELADTLVDGETSLYIAVDPAPEAGFDAALLVEGYSDSGRMTARGTGRFEATPDACNRFRVTLARTAPENVRATPTDTTPPAERARKGKQGEQDDDDDDSDSD